MCANDWRLLASYSNVIYGQKGLGQGRARAGLGQVDVFYSYFRVQVFDNLHNLISEYFEILESRCS